MGSGLTAYVAGFQKPPMFGDYEAQRHWMEVTTQLPISQWYFHDLPWWGLDYPPLTAYHSWLLGTIGSLIDPSWFALYTSRGSADPTLKIFMRATVIVSEYLIYIPAVVVFVRRYSRLSGVTTWTASVALVAILMQPATILIDHVHFQYNTVMLGFVLASMSSMLAGRYLWASVFFVAALGFKQMALYYAFSVFAYLLGNCTFPRVNMARLLAVAAVTLAAFAILVLPLVIGALYDHHRGIDTRPDPDGPRPLLPLFQGLADYLDTEAPYYPVVEQMVQVVHRIFPFARGLFEDKVANVWCAANVVVKLNKYPPKLLQNAALLATLVSIIPPNVILFFRPRKTLLPLAFAATAWGFFLFSYQVHEKSILLPLMPMTLLLARSNGLGKDTRAWVGFANLVGVWTLFPLLQRVDLRVPYTVLTPAMGVPARTAADITECVFSKRDGQLQSVGHGFPAWGLLPDHGDVARTRTIRQPSPGQARPLGCGQRRRRCSGILDLLPLVLVEARNRERYYSEGVVQSEGKAEEPVMAGYDTTRQIWCYCIYTCSYGYLGQRTTSRYP